MMGHVLLAARSTSDRATLDQPKEESLQREVTVESAGNSGATAWWIELRTGRHRGSAAQQSLRSTGSIFGPSTIDPATNSAVPPKCPEPTKPEQSADRYV